MLTSPLLNTLTTNIKTNLADSASGCATKSLRAPDSYRERLCAQH